MLVFLCMLFHLCMLALAVHVGAAVHAVHVDSAESAGPMAIMLWHNGYVTN